MNFWKLIANSAQKYSTLNELHYINSTQQLGTEPRIDYRSSQHIRTELREAVVVE